MTETREHPSDRIEIASGAIKGELANKLRRIEGVHGKAYAFESARFYGELTEILYQAGGYGQGSTSKNEILTNSKAIEGALFADSDALVASVGPDKKLAVEKNIFSAVSVLTFYDLLRQAYSPIRDIELSQLVATEHEDVEYAIDIVLRLGDTNPYNNNAEIVRLVQLKLSKGGGIVVEKLDDKNRRGSDKYLTGHRADTVERMQAYARRVESEAKKDGRNIEVQTYLVAVPGYENELIGNVFGFVLGGANGGQGRKEAAESFAIMARKGGLIPYEK